VRNEDDLSCMSVPDKYKVMGTFYKARARRARAPRTLPSACAHGCASTLTPLRPRRCAQYYTGEAVAPYPTLFIGGNHEATNYLWEARGRTQRAAAAPAS
jgi:lariat debranching enzyme